MDVWLNRLREEIEATTGGLCDADWDRAPVGRWSSAQILEHLGRSYGTTAKMLELSVGVGGPPPVRGADVSERLKKFLVVNLGVAPPGGKSPAMVLPQGDSGPVALQRALANLNRMDIAIAAAVDRWGSEGPIGMHPILGPLSPRQWRKFHYVHGHHHLLQIQKRVGEKAGR